MRSLIVGGGAIGQFCAARLAQAGHDVVVLARPQQAEPINTNGITLRAGTTVATLRVRATADAADSVLDLPFELVVTCVKSFSTPDATRTIASIPACQGASILTVQNGLGNEEILSQAFGADRIVAGALTVAVERLGAASIDSTSKGGLVIAPVGSHPQNWIMAAFGGSGMPVRATGNWLALKWSKLLLNILGNGVCAALDWLPAQVYADRDAFAAERACLLEAIAVMAKLKLPVVNLIGFPTAMLTASAQALPAGLLRAVLAQRVARGRGDKLPSLLMDLRAHRAQTEVDALNGAIASRALQASVPAPVNARVAEVVSGIASGRIDWNDYRSQPRRLL